MADTNTTPAPKTPAPKTVADDMKPRMIFSNINEAFEHLNGLAENISDFGKYPIAAPGMDEDGNFDTSVYTDSFEVMVAKLRRDKAGIKAIVVAPIPTLDSLLDDEAGRAFVRDIIRKELNHRAVRVLRDAEDVSTVIDQMPSTLSGYIESSRADGGIMESFNELYKPINSAMSRFNVWAKRRLLKQELRKAMESKGYAESVYGSLENYKGESLFVLAIKLGITSAKKKGLDTTIFDRWLETRDSKTFDPTADADDDESFDLDSLTDALLAEDAKSNAKPETETADEPTA